MSGEDECEKKCFTFIWKLENASYCWQKTGDCIESSSFEIDELEETKWKLRLFHRSASTRNAIGFYLLRDSDSKGAMKAEIDYELAILASDGSALQSSEKTKGTFQKNSTSGLFVSRNEVFVARSTFLPQDTFTLRCKMWKRVGEMSKDVQCFARTRIFVEEMSFLWKIKDFSTLESDEKQTYEIKSLESGQQLMCLELFVTGGQIFDEKIRFVVIPNYQIIKTSSFQLFIVDASKNLVECFQDEFWYLDPSGRREVFFLTKKKLMERKNVYLPDDVLSLQCEFSFTSGIVLREGNRILSECISVENNGLNGRRLQKENDTPVLKCILSNNLKSMVNNSCLSDVKLKTKSQTYPAHKTILGARSPVFKAMFSSDMREKIIDCVDVEDLNDDTVLRMLRYIYSAEVEELEWVSAIELYEAADKYVVLHLRDICSYFLKNSLCPSNACEALVLADLHQDDDLKSFVQDFIFRHGKDVINSEEWEKLMETNLKLAAETMRVKYKE
ncbi:Speckle-type POZ protein B [Araneus ventricosus]|uniref:Speckle-type POZ protein B n=1 Tax=Araneus ventricosus TaxID=182803 RepID=A0A4Y2T139_ARAVE|nr:Speckle-type POZ protein B [Araneus ventricosus]